MIRINDIFGYLLLGDVAHLFRRANELSDGSLIAEVGSFLGLSAAVMAAANRSIMVHCYDTWEGSVEHRDIIATKDVNLFNLFMDNIRKANVGDRIVIHIGESTSAVKNVDGSPFAMIFIDGSHDELSALEDLRAWWPKLEEGGVVLVHDCVPGGPVVRAVRKFTEEQQLTYRILAPPAAHYMAEIRK